jgi:hypothetical protein
MSDDTEKLQQTVYRLREAIDILERATPIVGAVAPGGLESLLQEAFTRFVERAGRYELESTGDAEREAVRAAVEPLARRVLGVETSVDDLWRNYCEELATKSPEDAFRKVVTRVVAAVGPARRQRLALKQMAELLNTTESADACVKQVWKILLEVGAEPLTEPLQSTVLVKDAPTADAGRSGLTEEQAQTARFEPLIAAWLAYFDAMDRQNASGKAADAQIVRELRAKANSNDRRAADVIYQIALARHRASRGETGP